MSTQFDDLEAFKVLIREIFVEDEVHLHTPKIDEHDYASVEAILRSGFVSTIGEDIYLLESKLSSVFSTHALLLNSGTSALHLALLALNVAHDDIVVVSPISFVATIASIVYVGAQPKFIDVDEKNLAISYDFLNQFITNECDYDGLYLIEKRSKKKVSAVLLTHPFGWSGEVEKIKTLCDQFGIKLIEDAAACIGNKSNGKYLGTIGDAGIFSFNGNKTITAGAGGALLVRDKTTFKRAKHLSATAKVEHPFRYVHDEIGFNYRMPNLNAALCLSQFRKLWDILKYKRKIHDYYLENISPENMAFLFSPLAPHEGTPWLNTIKLESSARAVDLLNYLIGNKIFVRLCWEPLHKLKPYSKYLDRPLPVADELQPRIINLPSYVG